MKIFGIDENTIAKELGISAGDELIAFDDFPVVDILDYEYYSSQEDFSMTIKHDGELVTYDIEKYADEELGLSLEREIPVRQCKNHCIFCFVDQLPKTEKLRDTLEVKDDDYRHSFISGNYITMTNLTDKDIERIIRLKLSPLYISVHSSNSVLRAEMLGLDNLPDIMSQIKKLYKGKIAMHTQVVYCPGINEDLEDTINAIYPYTKSLAIVPVGLTKCCNKRLASVTKLEAQKVIDVVDKWQKILLPKKNTRFVFAADEFYVKANAEIPPYENYEDFGQIENGIGLLAAFKNDFDFAVSLNKNKKHKIGVCSIATGESAYEFICRYANKLTERFGGQINVYKIKNNFFGDTVTVAGLVVGRDILEQLSGRQLGERLILPKIMLREFGDVFLDNMTVCELGEKLNIPIQIIPPDGESFVNELIWHIEKK